MLILNSATVVCHLKLAQKGVTTGDVFPRPDCTNDRQKLGLRLDACHRVMDGTLHPVNPLRGPSDSSLQAPKRHNFTYTHITEPRIPCLAGIMSYMSKMRQKHRSRKQDVTITRNLRIFVAFSIYENYGEFSHGVLLNCSDVATGACMLDLIFELIGHPSCFEISISQTCQQDLGLKDSRELRCLRWTMFLFVWSCQTP